MAGARRHDVRFEGHAQQGEVADQVECLVAYRLVRVAQGLAVEDAVRGKRHFFIDFEKLAQSAQFVLAHVAVDDDHGIVERAAA